MIPYFGGPYTTHEYRLYRPVDWRTGVPDAETVQRCQNKFALLMHEGSVLRECARQFDGTWWWGGAATGGLFIDPEYLGVQWCPEDEMPTEGKTT